MCVDHVCDDESSYIGLSGKRHSELDLSVGLDPVSGERFETQCSWLDMLSQTVMMQEVFANQGNCASCVNKKGCPFSLTKTSDYYLVAGSGLGRIHC